MRQHTVRVHLHHDHRDSLVADPDDAGTSRSLSGLLRGRGSLWGVGLSLTWLIRLVGRQWGRSLALHVARHRGTQVHLRHRQPHYSRHEEVQPKVRTGGYFETMNNLSWQ